MTQDSNKRPQLLNYGDLHGYVTGNVMMRLSQKEVSRKPTNDEITIACDYISEIIAKRPACLRAATPEEIAVHDTNGALEFQMQIFGRSFEMFVPEQDKELRDVIRQLAVRELKLNQTRESEEIYKKAKSSGSSLAAAFNGAIAGSSVAATLGTTSPLMLAAASGTASMGLVRTLLDIQPMRYPQSHDNSSALRRVELLKHEDSGEAACSLDMPFDKNAGRNLNHNFYRVTDKQDKLRGYFYAERAPMGDVYLMRCRLSPGILPDPITCEYISQYANTQRMKLWPDAGQTGIFLHRAPNQALALQSLPQGFISDEPLLITGMNNEFMLSNLKQINAAAGDRSTIKKCANFTSLGDLEFTSGNLNVEECPNFRSLGNLKQVGASGEKRKVSLSIVNCPQFKNLGNLRAVHGDLELNGTGINSKNFPASLDFVGGKVYLDDGTYIYQGKGWKFPLKPLGRSLWGPRHG